MKTGLTAQNLSSPAGRRADAILRNCVHCGFCNATCPTYQLTGDELDGPRGRIYLIKQVLEGAKPGAATRLHLDRCLTCRNCETTCPSGVRYGELLDIGRQQVAEKTRRTTLDALRRSLLHRLLLTQPLFDTVVRVGRGFRRLLPAGLRRQLPPVRQRLPAWPNASRERKVLLHEGCVQPALQPAIDRMTAVVLDRLGIESVRAPRSCCGAISHHMDRHTEAESRIKRNIDRWWPLIENGEIEAILSTASGCGVTLREYGQLLQDDAGYREKAAAVSELVCDPGEFLAGETFTATAAEAKRIAYHPPCTQQHGQQVRGVIEPLLSRLGHELLSFGDSHLCCGSAGTYSLLQPAFSRKFRDDKLKNIGDAGPDLIATANIGCMMQLQSGTGTPVKHWIELLFDADVAK